MVPQQRNDGDRGCGRRRCDEHAVDGAVPPHWSPQRLLLLCNAQRHRCDKTARREPGGGVTTGSVAPSYGSKKSTSGVRGSNCVERYLSDARAGRTFSLLVAASSLTEQSTHWYQLVVFFLLLGLGLVRSLSLKTYYLLPIIVFSDKNQTKSF